MAILAAALMDGLDGKVARLTHTASEFGVQLDSLADLVAFGLSPAILLWHWQLCNFRARWPPLPLSLRPAAPLRLARFNVSAGRISKRFYRPAHPGRRLRVPVCFLFLPLFSRRPTIRSRLVRACHAVAWSVLMVSRVRYFTPSGIRLSPIPLAA